MATGTGKTFRNILHKIQYDGTLYGVDLSPDMLGYVERITNRQKQYTNRIKLVHSTIGDFKLDGEEKSSLIISSFGFPSRIFNLETCKYELEAVYKNLSENGVFVTIGWDEKFSDELNRMWYKYIPDNIIADSFNEWSQKRAALVTSPRNCNLTWYKTNISVPLLFSCVEESVNVMGHLFGRDASNAVLEQHKTCWWMSMGITLDTKKTIAAALQKMR